MSLLENFIKPFTNIEFNGEKPQIQIHTYITYVHTHSILCSKNMPLPPPSKKTPNLRLIKPTAARCQMLVCGQTLHKAHYKQVDYPGTYFEQSDSHFHLTQPPISPPASKGTPVACGHSVISLQLA